MKNVSKKRIIIFSIIVFLVTTAATFAVLSLMHPKTQDTNNQIEAPKIVKGAEVINTVLRNEDLLKNTDGIIQQSTNSTQTNLTLHSTVLDTSFQQSTADFLTVYSSKGLTADQLNSYVSKLESLFEKQGMTKSTNNTTPRQITYEASNLYCQYTQQPSMDGVTHQIIIGCVDKKVVIATENGLKELLAAWPANNTKKSNLLILQQEVSADKSHAMTLSLVDQKTMRAANRLVYAKTDDSTWKFIGDASSGISVQPNDKYVITAEIKEALSNAGYGPAVKMLLGV